MITCRAVNYKLHGVNNIKEDHRVLDVFCKIIIVTFVTNVIIIFITNIIVVVQIYKYEV